MSLDRGLLPRNQSWTMRALGGSDVKMILRHDWDIQVYGARTGRSILRLAAQYDARDHHDEPGRRK
jgi:hypothetical protein